MEKKIDTLKEPLLDRGLACDILDVIRRDTLTDKTRKALIFGAIYGMAEYYNETNTKLTSCLERYVRHPKSAFMYVVITLDRAPKSQEARRRVDSVISQLDVEDLDLTFNSKEQVDVMLGRRYELQYLRALAEIESNEQEKKAKEIKEKE